MDYFLMNEISFEQICDNKININDAFKELNQASDILFNDFYKKNSYAINAGIINENDIKSFILFGEHDKNTYITKSNFNTIFKQYTREAYKVYDFAIYIFDKLFIKQQSSLASKSRGYYKAEKKSEEEYKITINDTTYIYYSAYTFENTFLRILKHTFNSILKSFNLEPIYDYCDKFIPIKDISQQKQEKLFEKELNGDLDFNNISFHINYLSQEENDKRNDLAKKEINANNRNLLKNLFLEYIKESNNLRHTFLSSYFVLYCKACRTNSLINLYLNNNCTVTCKKCNHIHYGDTRISSESEIIRSIKIFDDFKENGKVKLSIQTIMYKYNPKSNHFFPVQMNHKFIFDIKNNKSYYCCMANKKSKLIRNISYGINYVIEKELSIFFSDTNNYYLKFIINKLFRTIKKHLKTKHTFKDVFLSIQKPILNMDKRNIVKISNRNNINDHINNDRTNARKLLEKIAIINSNPNCSYEHLKEIKPYYNSKVTNYVRSNLKKDNKYMDRVLKTTPAIKKLLIDKPWKIPLYYIFKDCIKDNNHFLYLLKNIDTIASRYYEVLDIPEDFKDNVTTLKKINKRMIEIFKYLMSIYNNETVLINKILNKNTPALHDRYFLDSINALDYVINSEYKEEYTSVFNKKWDLKEIHDSLIRYKNLIRMANRTISYSDEELKLERKYNDFEFKLAKDTHELTFIGNSMSICVGGYGDRAYRKMLNIIYLMRDNKYIACIELRGNKVEQTKCKYNSLPEGDVRKIILKWIEDNKLVINTRDIRLEEFKEELNSTFDLFIDELEDNVAIY